MGDELRKLANSFRYALRGIWYCILNERNMRIHLVAAGYVFFISRFFSLTKGENTLLILTVCAVLMCEMINTSIETVINLLSPAYHILARIAKDIAAGAVFVSAAASVAVAVILLGDPLGWINFWNMIRSNSWGLLFFLLSVLLAVCFVFAGPKMLRKLTYQPKGKRR